MERDELRKKIKQLKYKIEKEEAVAKELALKVQQLHRLNAQELSNDRILKKINFKLREKGLDFDDWLRCLPYHSPFSMEELLRTGKSLGLGLDREESNLLINFMAEDMSSMPTFEEIKSECNRSGIWMKDQ